MLLGEFAVDFIEGALISVEEEKISQEDSITRDIIEYIKDCGEVIEPEISHYKVRGIKINAYDYDDDNETIDLFVTIYKAEERLQKTGDKDIEDAFNKALNFFWAAREGKLSERIDESENKVYELVQIIEQTKSTVTNVRIFVLTNGTASVDVVPDAREENGVLIDFQLWDIERVYQQYLIRSGKQKIEVDFVNDFGFKVKCLQMENVSDKVEAYLAIMPAKVLAEVYEKYRQGLLEKNVRTFLQFKAKVNQGIRDTIRREPDMFFAYNNGISTTAEKIEIDIDNNIPYITRIENWQIVNGGQTTASIFATSTEKDCNLSKVFVQTKISVISPDADMEGIVPKISRFANSQTAIKDSDFSSNSPYHIELERLSRSEWVPARTGGKATNKWFYERTRGQYLDEKTKRTSPSDLKKYDIEYPKRQKFSKTDLAKYEMSWWQRPFDVSKGAENNFKIFTKEMSTDKAEVNRIYYQRLIAKAILFKEIDRIVMKRSLGGYKANMVSYLLSWLSYKTNKRLNLDSIWESQNISEAVYSMIEQMIDVVWTHINSPSKAGMNIGEWCKKQECWLTLKDKFIDITSISEEIKNDVNYIEKDLVGQELSPQEMKIIEEASKIKAEIWFSIAKWAKDHNKFTPFDRKLAYNLGVLANRKSNLSPKQAKNALRILKASEEEGFNIR